MYRMDSIFFWFPTKEQRRASHQITSKKPQSAFSSGTVSAGRIPSDIVAMATFPEESSFLTAALSMVSMMHTATSVFCPQLGCDEDQNKGNFRTRILRKNKYASEMTVEGAQE